ncbi:MAG: hypothetical protein P4L84_14880 [Isosphaeraceae bacterium]|nr:hypothetical protein [Isosphaeraceae bacterium]
MPDANGDGGTSGELRITVEELRPDWVTIRPELSDFRKMVELERIPNLLEQTLIAWLKGHPKAKVRAALGLVEDGFTIAVHLWLDGP